MHGGEPIHWFLSRTYLKQTKSFNDGSDKYFCCNTTKHNGNSANIIHTQNALQVYERRLMKLHSEFICGNISRPITQTKATDCICPLRFFLMLRTHLQDTRLLLEFTWFYEYCVNLLNLPDRYTLYTHGGFWRSTWRNLDLKERDVCWAFNLLFTYKFMVSLVLWFTS